MRSAEGTASRTLALCEVRLGCLVTAPGQPPAVKRTLFAVLSPQLHSPWYLSSCHHVAGAQHRFCAAELLEGGTSEGAEVAM